MGGRRLGHEIGFGSGIAHGFATLGTIGFVGRFDYAAVGTVSNVAPRLCDEAKPGQFLISARVLMKVENAARVEPVGEFELKGIRWPRIIIDFKRILRPLENCADAIVPIPRAPSRPVRVSGFVRIARVCASLRIGAERRIHAFS